jgi:hypothetical protein
MFLLAKIGRKRGLMAEGIFHYYFLLSEDAAPFIDKMAPWLQNAGFRPLTADDGEALPDELPFKPAYWQFAADEGSGVLALAFSPESTGQNPLQQLKSLEQEAGVDVDMILGQATVVIAPGKPFEEVLKQYQAVVRKRPGTELPLKAGRLMRHVLSSTSIFYIAIPEAYDARNSHFWGQRLAQLEGQHFKMRIITRLLGEQLNSVKREYGALEHELSLILHSNLVSKQGELAESEELDEQLKLLTTSYAKLAGNRRLIAEGKANLQALLNQFTRQLRQEPAFDFTSAGFNTLIENYQQRLEQLTQTEAHLQVSQQDYQAAIEVVRSRIDIMNSRSNLATQAQIRELMEHNTQMQKQSLVFQYAAGLIEFIVLAYYSHSLWKNLAYQAYNMIPASIQFMVVLLFSGHAVYCTHLLAEYIQGEHEVKNKVAIALLLMALLLGVIIVYTAWISSQGVPGALPGH